MSWKYKKKMRGNQKKRRKERMRQQNRKSYKYRNALIKYDREERLGNSIKAV